MKMRILISSLAFAIAMPFIAAGASASPGAVRDFQLPSPNATPTPQAQGPIDVESAAPTAPRVIATDAPAPQPTRTAAPNPAPTPSTRATTAPRPADAQPSARATTRPATQIQRQPARTATPQPTRPAPSIPSDQPSNDPGAIPATSDSELPAFDPSEISPAVQSGVQPSQESASTPYALPLNLTWWFAALAAALAAIAAIIFFRRRQPALANVPEIAPPLARSEPIAKPEPIPAPTPEPAPESAPEPAAQPVVAPAMEAQEVASSVKAAPRVPVQLKAYAVSLSRSIMYATLSYRLDLRNLGTQSLKEVTVRADVVTAHGKAPMTDQLGNAESDLDVVSVLGNIPARDTQQLTAEFQLPVRSIKTIRQGNAMLYVPLLRVRVDVDGQEPLIKTFVIGMLPAEKGGKLQPFRLDEMAQTYRSIGLRPLD